ncbi:MAG TPA: Holliday junction resolvase RuvX [Deltaproteobacteria bacterium]|nr:Holliday junction resolvase RuvX [Deltaproteobacteria bacterium]
MRVLCLDVGEKRIGFSISDTTCTIAQALKVYNRYSLKKDLEEIKNIINEYNITQVVVGLPKNLNGTLGKKGQEIMDFASEIERYTSIPTALWDERFSTNEAHRMFSMAGVKHKKRKLSIDMIASQIILQGYLDACKKT